MSDAPINTDAKLDAAVVLGLLFLLGAVLGLLAFVTIPEHNMTLFAALAMGVNSGLSIYLGYRWGASKSGATKDATIAAMVPRDGQ